MPYKPHKTNTLCYFLSENTILAGLISLFYTCQINQMVFLLSNFTFHTGLRHTSSQCTELLKVEYFLEICDKVGLSFPSGDLDTGHRLPNPTYDSCSFPGSIFGKCGNKYDCLRKSRRQLLCIH